MLGDKQSCDADGTCTNIGNPFIGSQQFALKDLPETSYQTYYFQFVVSHLYDPLHPMCACFACTNHQYA